MKIKSIKITDKAKLYNGKSEDVIPTLIKPLDDTKDHVRSTAARTLGRFGPVAKIAVTKLQEVVNLDLSEPVREEAAAAIKEILEIEYDSELEKLIENMRTAKA